MIWSQIVNARRAAVFCVLLPLLISGCRSTPFVEGGPEIHYLTSKPPIMKVARSKNSPLLPLSPGTTWEMQQIGVPPGQAQRIDGRVVKRDSNGSLIEFRRNGELWRREVYSDHPDGLYLIAMGEENKPMMHLSPPVPITLYPAREGNGKAWNGTFRYGDVSYPANGYSRISALETAVGPTGKNQVYRTDTLIAINQNGAIVKFPTLRWLTPGIGFVRRSFVDQGHPVYVELLKFTQG